ncbi:MAG TPA: hypothetical protein VK186_13355, partial [Candidatus Deferrimicrobium sp.]|nr:hypothetical protein [Candidatus Deferrimicrobium sp.]
LERIIRLNPKYLLPSHGLLPETVTILEKTLEHRKKREQEILELYRNGKTPEEIVAKIYKRVNKELVYLALENIKAHLKKLEQEGMLNNSFNQGSTVR